VHALVRLCSEREYSLSEHL